MSEQISTKGMSREAWLKIRRKSIGGSDAAAIIGLNRYQNAFSVWEEKTGRAAEKPLTEAMRLGTFLEEYVAQRFTEETGKRVRRRNAILYNPEYPFAHANIDREIVGEDALLECKTTSQLNLKQFSGGEYPANYYVQVMHYLAVTGMERGYIAVLIGNKDFRVFQVERDEKEISSLMEAERDFWGFVEADEAPPAQERETESDGTTVDLFGRAEIMRQYLSIKGQCKALEKEADAIAETIKTELGTHERGRDGSFTAIWKTQQRTSFDQAALAAAHPELDLSPFIRTTSTRVFTVKEAKTA